MPSTTLAPIPTSLTLSALMLASSALAADPPTKPADGNSGDPKPVDPREQQLKEVTVQGDRQPSLSSMKQTKSLLDTAQTATVISAEVIRQQGDNSLVQVLRNSPGISMQAGEGGTGGAPGDSLSIRGFNARKDIFVDGVRDFGSYSRDTFNLNSVEIVKGPSSALAGRGSTGGFVNLVTKQPQKDTFYAGTAGVGTDSYSRITLDLNQSLDDGKDGALKGAAFRINAVGFNADTPGRDYVNNQRLGFAPTLTFGLGTPTQVSLGFFHLSQDNMPDFGIPFVPLANNAVPGVVGYGNKVAPVPYSNFYGLVARDHEDIYTNIGTLTVRHDFGNGVLLSNHTQYGLTYRDSIISAPRFSNTTTTRINHELQTLDETDTGIVNQTDVVIRFATGSAKHTVNTGLEIGRETSGNVPRGAYNPGTSPATSAPLAAAAFPTTDLFHPDAFQPYAYSVLRTGAQTYTVARTLAAYAFDTIDLNDRWSVMAGLRWDRFQADSEATSSTFTGNVVTNLNRTDRMLNWRASIAYKPASNGNIYLAAGTSSSPSAEGLTLAAAANSLNSANLGPEKSISFELGTKWEVFDKLLLTAALFQIDKTHARTEDPANPNDLITLDGKQRMQGIELSASGKLTPEWGMTAGYSYLHGKIVSSANPLEVGQPMSSAPKNSASLWTTYVFPGHWEVGGGFTYVGERVVNTTNTRQVDGYATLDAMVAYRVNSTFTMRLNGYNLTNKSYVLDMYNTGSSGHVIPGSGRSAVLTGEFFF